LYHTDQYPVLDLKTFKDRSIKGIQIQSISTHQLNNSCI